MASGNSKYLGTIVEYLDQGKLRPALVVREGDKRLVVVDASGREKAVAPDLVLVRHHECRADLTNLQPVLSEIEAERAKLAADLDLNLLWEVVHEHNRAFDPQELAELFFGRRSPTAVAVLLENLLDDRLYFTRRHMEFVARSSEQVERLRVQHSRERLKTEGARRTRALIKEVLDGGAAPTEAERTELAAELTAYLKNPFTRRQELEALLTYAVPEVPPAEIAIEVLEWLGVTLDTPRFALIGGLPRSFNEAAIRESIEVIAPDRPLPDAEIFAITIDDEETREIDDALSCTPEPDGILRVSVHIALPADFVPRDGAMDREAAMRAATVYLPETIVRMLPDEISCQRASLIAGELRPVLTTEVRLGAGGELMSHSIRPGLIRIGERLDYKRADLMLAQTGKAGAAAVALGHLHDAAMKLRERRRQAGAIIFHRRETKVRVHQDRIEIELIDNNSPSRNLVAEFMVLSNYIAAKYAADNRLPIIYRVQPNEGGDAIMQRARLSLYPEYHAGIGLECYAQLSSPLRRYADLVLQRQLLAALGDSGARAYDANELLTILAKVENAEAESKELERRAKRYWILRYLERHAREQPLAATMLRDGYSAELSDYAIRGSLHGTPSFLQETQIAVQIDRIDPLRGLLALRYAGPANELHDAG
ncbi:MAG: RNB domain-containing ribonuclease [Candidatus Binataceae bacterium]|nr:RNB domain-containing ribonuclease [Candidatus Binataceae bacterium]